MEAVYKTAEIAANMFDAAGAVIFLAIIFGGKDRTKIKSTFYFMSMVFIMVLAIFQDVSDNVVIQIIIMIIIGFAYELLFLNGKIGEKLIYNILYNMIILITNMFTVFGMIAVIHVDMEVLIKEGSYLRVITLIINKVMIMIFLVSVILFTKRKQFEYQEWVIAVLMYITTVFTDTIFINIVKTGRLPRNVENQFIWAALGLFLIDNAIEAEERETEKWIKVEMSEYKGVFIIQISNFIGKSVLKENPMLLTGKKDFRNHGVGTRSVKKTVKKLGGVYYNEEGDNQFIANVMLN